MGLGLPDQRADRAARAGRDGAGWCPTPATRTPAGSTPSACSCRSSASCCSSTASSRAASWPTSPTRPCCATIGGGTRGPRRVRRVREAQRPSVDRRQLLQEQGVLGRDRRHRARLLRADGRDLLLGLLHPERARLLAAADRPAAAAAGRRPADLRAARPAGRRPLRGQGHAHGGHARCSRRRWRRSPLLDADTPIWLLEVVFFLHGRRNGATS